MFEIKRPATLNNHIYIPCTLYHVLYIKYRLLYHNLMVTANQESIMHTKMEKKSKHNTKYSHQIKRTKEKGKQNSPPMYLP